MIDSILKVVQGWVKLKGGTDGTMIGNSSDSLKVSTGTSFDAFGRSRVSLPVSQFDTTFNYDISDIVFSKLTANSGTIAHDNNKKTLILSSANVANSNAAIQSRQYIIYHPAKSNFAVFSVNFKGAVSGVKKYIGQFDSSNGFYHVLDGTTLKIGIRSKISGSVVNTEVAQSSWNLDKLDGTGASGYTLNMNNSQLPFIEYQWLGVGAVKFGYCIDGKFIYCHQVLHTNIITTLYSQTATLPVRFQVIGQGVASLEVNCCSVISEGFTFNGGISRTVNTGVTAKNVAGTPTNYPLLSISKQASFSTMLLEIKNVGCYVSSADEALLEVVYNPTLIGSSWVNVDGIARYDVTATSYTGGRKLISEYIRGGSGITPINLINRIEDSYNRYIGADISGNSDVLTISVSNITSAISYFAYIDYKEIS